MAFADKVELEVQAGRGGDGKLGFRHAKFQAKGGPDGGDGGNGGNVILVASHNENTLADFRTKRLIKAGDGEIGGTERKHGKAGTDQIVKVPLGTVVFENSAITADLSTDGQEFVLAKGGKGGFGNAHFASSNRQAPRIAELGEPGEHKQVVLELKLVADIGLVGLPNAGKSTLLATISNAKPEIADYPFTTLAPNLGVTEIDGATVLVADIPGLIEGASTGKGLGDDFLRHIERTAVLIHLIDANNLKLSADWKTINAELKNYEVDLTAKPQLVALTKIDALQGPSLQKKLKEVEKASGSKVYAISAVAHKGVTELLRAAWPLVKAARETKATQESEALPIINETSMPDLWKVEKIETGFRVIGTKIERFALRSNFENDDSLQRMRAIMGKMGIAKELERQGVEPGDIIYIGEKELNWL